jgi:hypothetical protein
MNAVAAMKWTLAKIKEQGAAVTLGTLDQCLQSESLPEADHNECREWLDGVLARNGRDYRAMDALVLKLTTIGSAISERLTKVAIDGLSAEEIDRLMGAYLDFKHVIEEVLPRK